MGIPRERLGSMICLSYDCNPFIGLGLWLVRVMTSGVVRCDRPNHSRGLGFLSPHFMVFYFAYRMLPKVR